MPNFLAVTDRISEDSRIDLLDAATSEAVATASGASKTQKNANGIGTELVLQTNANMHFLSKLVTRVLTSVGNLAATCLPSCIETAQLEVAAGTLCPGMPCMCLSAISEPCTGAGMPLMCLSYKYIHHRIHTSLQLWLHSPCLCTYVCVYIYTYICKYLCLGSSCMPFSMLSLQ